MPLTLYAHNQRAYAAVSTMMPRTGKAAVVHPTGTGKSFIAFQLIADHPDARILWLSPSEYIFRTQCENLARLAPDVSLQNVEFYTYAKLMQMTQPQLEALAGGPHTGSGLVPAPTPGKAHTKTDPNLSPALGGEKTNITDGVPTEECKALPSAMQTAGENAPVPSAPLAAEIAQATESTPLYIKNKRTEPEKAANRDEATETPSETTFPVVPPPTYIILDEFHRCGAACWGQGVAKLLALCPNAQLLGLSATNIRYLDNQRDMADELFDGNIASEMTLGEAIVRGILPTPKYVTTVFKYQQALEKYQQRIDDLRGSGLRDANQSHLNALRRALEKAEGLPQLFRRHITPKDGRYILFCSHVDQMRDIAEAVPLWFSGVDGEPHIYTVYSEDPGTSRAFADFKSDESDHLKLLLCIDMLNEGVHVRGISGVILFRPTVSPTLYKQQIGRALTAGESDIPLILDIVNNYEGLCSIGYLKEEMHTAMQHMRANGESDEIVIESFEVQEQIEDCRKLFERLEASLASSWDQYCHAASLYAAEHGNLEVPKRYVTASGLCLGAWINTQRMVRKGSQPGALSEAQIARLDAIGMVWDNLADVAWERGFQCAKQYYEKHENLQVPVRYCTENGFALGKWIANLRRSYIDNKETSLLTEERIARLEKIGMVWDVHAFQWEQKFAAATAYYKENGDLEVPVSYKTKTGIALGIWIRAQRQIRQGRTTGRLTEEQIRRLDTIGMNWGSTYDVMWEKAYQQAEEYAKIHGNLEIPLNYMTPDGIQLGKWIRRQRYARQCPEKSNSILTPDRIARLDALGMVWESDNPWEHRYQLTEQYYSKNGNTNIPAKYKTADGIWLGRWVYEQKRLYAGTVKGRGLLPEQRKKLEKLGIV